MDTILDYDIIEETGQTSRFVTYRGKKRGCEKTSILKVIKGECLSPTDLALFKQEADKIIRIDHYGIVRLEETGKHNGSFVMVQEDFRGITLKNIIKYQRLSVPTFLRIACNLAETLGCLHQKNVFHREITPNNIVVDYSIHHTKITDFGIISVFNISHQNIYQTDIIEDTLFYISPEQTGRMNRTIDFRTDFYSLGVTFYEVLTGRVPFMFDDPIELFHAHIAKTPVPPIQLNPKVPVPVSEIVMKLLAKTAEERYQNGYGLKADLLECIRQYEETGRITSFELRRKDFPLSLQIPQKLVGRENEIKSIMSAFHSVSQGEKKVIMVSGRPGIGKSALIHETNKPITAKHGYFISGKYERFNRDIPYSGIIQAFQGLVRHILSESKERLDRWKKDTLEALGPLAGVLTDVIPDMEFIIGQQPEVAVLGPEESQNRLNFVFETFIKLIARPECPLVLFLDDLQWIDIASLQFIKLIMMEKEMHYLLLIGSFRDNEVDSDHSLSVLLNNLENEYGTADKIKLAPLNSHQISNFIADFLKCDNTSSNLLAELVYEKTGGNPFFVRHFLKTLYDEKKLKVDPVLGWTWNMQDISRMQVTDNIVELLAGKISQLSEKTKEVLTICACIGNQFDLGVLSAVLGESVDTTFAYLSVAITEGLIIRADVYMFQHDRIQEAAYSLLSEDQKQQLHYKIGQYLLKTSDEDALTNNLFYIISQLNHAIPLITDQNEKNRLSKMNLDAGKKAKESAAFHSSLVFLQTGINLLPGDCWQSLYKLTLSLFIEAAEAAYLNSDFPEMERLISHILSKAKTLLDSIKIYEIRICALNAQNKLGEAIDVGIEALALLGMKFPRNPSSVNILISLCRLKMSLRAKTDNDILSLPRLTDSRLLAGLRIISAVSTVAYWSSPKLLLLLFFETIRSSLKHGLAPVTVHGYAVFASILCMMGNISSGYRFAKLVEKMSEKIDVAEFEPKIEFTLISFALHWKEHLQEATPRLLRIYQQAQENGDAQFLCYALMKHCSRLFYVNENLSQAEQIVHKNIKIIERFDHKTALYMARLVQQVMLNLLGKNNDPTLLVGANYDETKMAAIHREANDRTSIPTQCFYKMFLNLLFYNYSQAVVNGEKAMEEFSGLSGTNTVPDVYFFYSMALISVYSKCSSRVKHHYKKIIYKNRKKLKNWNRHAPMNQSHKFNLLEAELANIIKEDNNRATRFYDKAIHQAKQNGFVFYMAFGNELAAKFYLSKEQTDTAALYMFRACEYYRQWGAIAKVDHLENTYGSLIADSNGRRIGKSGFNFDLMAVANSLQMISKEIILDDLLRKLMKTVVEIAGAQRGVLILCKEGGLYVEAEYLMENNHFQVEDVPLEEKTVVNSIPLDKKTDVPAPIINLVWRTKQTIVLDHAIKEGDFVSNPYVVATQQKSIFCLPIIRKLEVTGILYLENNQAAYAFTPDRVTVLELLASQAAISLENAMLYETLAEHRDNLEMLVEKRTHALKEAEIKTRSLLENSPDYIINIDRDFKIQYINRTAPGLSLVRTKQADLFDYLMPEHHETFKQKIQQTFRTGSGDKIETKVKNVYGIVFWYEIRLVAVKKDYQVREVMLIATDITKRKKAEDELSQAQKELIEKAHQAGMADVASSTLHNVGNLLNSVKTSSRILFELSAESNIEDLLKANAMLKENMGSIETFITSDPNGIKLLKYYLQLGNSLAEEQNKITKHSKRMLELISLIENVMVAQRNYAGVSSLSDKYDIAEIIDDALAINEAALKAGNVNVIKEYIITPTLIVQKAKLMHILINLIKNAIEAMAKTPRQQRNLTVVIRGHSGIVQIAVSDNGEGISSDKLGKVFNSNYSTKIEGHGFGLHSSAIYMSEMGAKIWAESDGEGKGATFVLQFPQAHL